MSEGVRDSDRPRARQNPPRVGSAVTALALLLAVTSLALAGYEFYQRVTSGRPMAAVDTRDALRVELQRQAAELQRIGDDVARLDARAQNEVGAPAAATSNGQAAIPDRMLRLVEAEYLLQSEIGRAHV